ncbi:Multidrug resistance protein MdtA [compost metagenome]
MRPLAERNALSQRDLDDAVGKQQAAAASVEAARANVTNAKLNLGYTTIKSPVTGVSSFAKKQAGSYIDASNSLLTYVAKLDPMWVNFSLSENEVLSARSEQDSGALKFPPKGAFDVVIVLADGSQFPHHGKITFADASFSAETGTYMIRAEVSNPNGTLRPGQFVRVKLHGAERTQAVAVPQEAVIQGPRGQMVWVIDKDSKAQQRVVEVGQWTGDNWVIRSGLKPGEHVVVTGALRLGPGAPVKMVEVKPGQHPPGQQPGQPDAVAPASGPAAAASMPAATAARGTESAGSKP